MEMWLTGRGTMQRSAGVTKIPPLHVMTSRRWVPVYLTGTINAVHLFPWSQPGISVHLVLPPLCFSTGMKSPVPVPVYSYLIFLIAHKLTESVTGAGTTGAKIM